MESSEGCGGWHRTYHEAEESPYEPDWDTCEVRHSKGLLGRGIVVLKQHCSCSAPHVVRGWSHFHVSGNGAF
ncbi:hypothetical protein E2C01_070743 [Portunus trituberculatus]|uniref:Uncharacterized protein n=1 Tax=Portunus trituberculatus TaxID=210409 RepID=A0A5B7I259_PORTR|nr:hypothetical protein [Portunus trituberculatus]